MAERCPSCGRELGDIVHITYRETTVIVDYETVDDVGERTELEHVCGDRHSPDQG